jgi:hypothetical protein
VGPNHLSRLEIGESGGPVDDRLPDVDLFRIEVIPDYFHTLQYSSRPVQHLGDILQLIQDTYHQGNELLVYHGTIVQASLESIQRRCILDHERPNILWECQDRVAGGHVGGKYTA